MRSRWVSKWLVALRISAVACAGHAEVIKAAREGKMDALLIRKLDRLGRDTVMTLEFIQGLEQLGIETYSPLDGEIQLEQGILN